MNLGRADSYLGQDLVRLDVGPVRACYLVPDMNLARLTEAITEASKRWGGVTEPILAVRPAGIATEHWHQIVNALNPDLFIDMGLDDDARAAASSQLGSDLTSLRDFTGGQPGFPWRWCHPLVVDGRSGDAPVPYPSDDLRALAGVGAVDSILTWSAHGPGVQQPSDAERRVLTQLTRNTTAWLSARQVGEEVVGRTAAPELPAILWVSEENSFTDAIGFWNVRALVATSSVVSQVAAILIPPDLPDWTDAAELFALNVHARYPRPAPDAFIFSHTITTDQLRVLASQLNLTETTPPADPPGDAPRSLGRQPDLAGAPTAVIGLDPTLWCCYPRRYGRDTSELVQVFSGPIVFRAPSPVPFRIGMGGFVQVGLSGLRALAVPRRRAVAQLFAPDASFSGDRLHMQRGATNLFEIAVTIPQPPEVLSAVLSESGLTYRLSDKGLYVQALLARAPGLQDLVRQPGALEVITDLTRTRTEQFRTDLEALLAGRSVDTALQDDILALARERVPLPHRSVAELPKHGLPAAIIAESLERLAALGLCARGFSIECAACQLESYIELGEVTPQPACPGCGTPGAYRAAANRPAGPVTRYRLNSLLDRASDQGAPPHILGMACLHHHADGKPLFMLPGVQLYDQGRDIGEIDLLGYLAHQVLVGEVKTSPADFTEQQIRKDLAKAGRVGADIYLMVAIHQISPEQEAMAAQLAAAQGCELLAFSGDDARPSTSSSP